LIDNVGTKPANNQGWTFGGGTGGTLDVTQLLLNDGLGKFTDDTVNRITGEPGADDNAVKCADLNNDNHYDMIVASLQGRSEKLLMNDGSGHFYFVADGIPYGFSGSTTDGDFSLGIEMADFNDDKMLDMVTGQGEGRNYDEKVYFGGGGSVPDTKPPIFRAIETPSPLHETPTVIRYALRDNVTNESGQMVKATSITYQVAGGTPKVVKGAFYGGDLFRATIPAQSAGTTVTVKLSATDRAGNTGVSAPFSFTVPTPVAPPVVNPGSSAGGGGSGGGSATAGSGGIPESAGAAGSGEAGVAESGEGGEGGEVSVAGAPSVGGASPGTGGKGGSSSSGEGDAGESTGTAGGGGKGHWETVEEGGCSVSSSTPATKGRGAALLGFGLAMFGLVRRRNRKH
jgi:MYXO-CTERM domain-containing protein